MNWFTVPYILTNLITNSIHAGLAKKYKSSGMSHAQCLSMRVKMVYNITCSSYTVPIVLCSKVPLHKHANCTLRVPLKVITTMTVMTTLANANLRQAASTHDVCISWSYMFVKTAHKVCLIVLLHI